MSTPMMALTAAVGTSLILISIIWISQLLDPDEYEDDDGLC